MGKPHRYWHPRRANGTGQKPAIHGAECVAAAGLGQSESKLETGEYTQARQRGGGGGQAGDYWPTATRRHLCHVHTVTKGSVDRIPNHPMLLMKPVWESSMCSSSLTGG